MRSRAAHTLSRREPTRISREPRALLLLSGSGVGGSAPMVGYVSAPPSCHPGLVPGSRATAPFSPGFSGPRHKAGVTAGGTRTAGAGTPQSVSRSNRWADNPPVPTPRTRSGPSKPDSSGTSPGMTCGGNRCAIGDRDGRRGRAAIRVRGRPCRRKSARTLASHPAHESSTGQPWLKAGVAGLGSATGWALPRPRQEIRAKGRFHRDTGNRPPTPPPRSSRRRRGPSRRPGRSGRASRRRGRSPPASHRCGRHGPG